MGVVLPLPLRAPCVRPALHGLLRPRQEVLSRPALFAARAADGGAACPFRRPRLAGVLRDAYGAGEQARTPLSDQIRPGGLDTYIGCITIYSTFCVRVTVCE